MVAAAPIPSSGTPSGDPLGARAESADIWGYCSTCQRWFYCDRWFDPAAPHPCCPVCASEPQAIENRAGGDVGDRRGEAAPSQ